MLISEASFLPEMIRTHSNIFGKRFISGESICRFVDHKTKISVTKIISHFLGLGCDTQISRWALYIYIQEPKLILYILKKGDSIKLKS